MIDPRRPGDFGDLDFASMREAQDLGAAIHAAILHHAARQPTNLTAPVLGAALIVALDRMKGGEKAFVYEAAEYAGERAEWLAASLFDEVRRTTAPLAIAS